MHSNKLWCKVSFISDMYRFDIAASIVFIWTYQLKVTQLLDCWIALTYVTGKIYLFKYSINVHQIMAYVTTSGGSLQRFCILLQHLLTRDRIHNCDFPRLKKAYSVSTLKALVLGEAIIAHLTVYLSLLPNRSEQQTSCPRLVLWQDVFLKVDN